MTDLRDRWETAADPGRRIGHAVEVHESIGSTNDRARARLAQPGGEGVAILAEEQTAGRGRHGRTWTSPPGRNLTVSLALRPALPATSAWMLSAAAALALREACHEAVGSGALRVGLKWPNDLVAPDGRKVAGILTETVVSGDRLAQAVIGSGVNVNWPRAEMPPEIAERAASLVELAGAPVDRVRLLGAYLAALERWILALEAGSSPLEAYRAASWLDGRMVRVAVAGEALDGRVVGIGADGALLIDRAGVRTRVGHGEVLRVVPDAAAVLR